MWFKQVQVFELKNKLLYQPEHMAAELQSFALIPCLPSLPFSFGWISPFGKEGAPLVMAADGYILICLGIEERLLPSTVISQTLGEQIKEIESKENRRVGQKQRQALKDEIIQTLLPKAFVKSYSVFACIDTRRQWLWLASTSPRQTEQFTLAWQKVFPALGLVKPELGKVSSILTHWIQHASYPKQFVPEKNFVLQDSRQQSRIIRCQQQELSASSIQSFLKDSCEVRQLAICWQERIHFSMDDQLQLKNVRFSDESLDKLSSFDDSPEIKLASDFTLLTANLTELFTDLFANFAKIKEPTGNSVKKLIDNPDYVTMNIT